VQETIFSLDRAGQKKDGLSVIQTSGIAMSGVRHVNKIPTIRGTDIIRDPRLNKVMCRTAEIESCFLITVI